MREPNYFLYIVGTTNTDGLARRGDCGVGRTETAPGICDAPYGTLYVVSEKYIFREAGSRYPCPETIKYNILKYYGIS